MSGFSWGVFVSDYGVEVLAWITTSVIVLVIGFLKGKKVSSDSVGRKNNIYLPLIEELESMNNTLSSPHTKIGAEFLKELVNNNYKYAIKKSLFKKMEPLINKIDQYNKINLLNVAHNIIVKQFIQGFEDLYKSTIDGTSYHSDEYGNEYEVEHEVEELTILERDEFDDLIVSLLSDEGMPSYAVKADGSDVEYVYEQIVKIYSRPFNAIINGKKMPARASSKILEGTPAEYMSYNYDFFDAYNKNPKTIEKYELRAEIRSQAHSLVQELKKQVQKIVERYEVENI